MNAKTAALVFRANILFSFLAGGLLWASGSIPGFDAPTVLAFDLLSWPVDGAPGALNPTAKFMSAIGGGVLEASVQQTHPTAPRSRAATCLERHPCCLIFRDSA